MKGKDWKKSLKEMREKLGAAINGYIEAVKAHRMRKAASAAFRITKNAAEFSWAVDTIMGAVVRVVKALGVASAPFDVIMFISGVIVMSTTIILIIVWINRGD